MSLIKYLAVFVILFPSIAAPQSEEYSDAINHKINMAMPIFAEYCVISPKINSNKFGLKLLQILDTITKIRPYEYEDILECDCSFLFYTVYLLNYTTYGLSSIDNYCNFDGKWLKIIDIPFFRNTSGRGDKKYEDEWFDKNDVSIDSNSSGYLNIDWSIKANCQDDRYFDVFSGTYKIRVVGECKDEEEYIDPRNHKINPVMPIFAEYCVSYSQKNPDKFHLNLMQILDTTTKIRPYEYKDVLEYSCHATASVDFPLLETSRNKRISGMNILAGYCTSDGKWQEIMDIPLFKSTSFKFYDFIGFGKKDIGIDSNSSGYFNIDWRINTGRPEEKHIDVFSGTYKIHVVGECSE